MDILIIILLVAVLAFTLTLLLLLKKIRYYKMAIGNVSAMVIMQRMFELMAAPIPSNEKLKELNRIVIDRFGTGYSTISVYDGAEHEIRASNVDETYVDRIREIATEQDFKMNALQNTSKYLIAAPPRVLGYKTAMERQIRSAMFSPIYYDGAYKGFWLMEDGNVNAYDGIAQEELARLKDDIGVFLENVLSQEVIEHAHNTDKQTGFYNNLYLYSVLRQKVASHDVSCIVLMKMANIVEINNQYGREVGNRLISKVAKLLSETLSGNNVLVRYSGSRFCIVSPGITADTLHQTLERFLSNARTQDEMVNNQRIQLNINIVMETIKRQSNMEKEITKISDYADGMKETNTIKII